MKVIVKANNIEGALRLFKRKIKESNKLTSLREKEHYSKPSTKNNRAKASAKLREKRRQEKSNGI
jgi:ribosomal protein S21